MMDFLFDPWHEWGFWANLLLPPVLVWAAVKRLAVLRKRDRPWIHGSVFPVRLYWEEALWALFLGAPILWGGLFLPRLAARVQMGWW